MKTSKITSLSLGETIRRQRHRLGWTLDEVADRSGVSKPYLSLVENAQVQHPPITSKLRALEVALRFRRGELQAFGLLDKTPSEVVDVLRKLLHGRRPAADGNAALAMMLKMVKNG
jgi:transcriptional regulator with XRE-family HTH domain